MAHIWNLVAKRRRHTGKDASSSKGKNKMAGIEMWTAWWAPHPQSLNGWNLLMLTMGDCSYALKSDSSTWLSLSSLQSLLIYIYISLWKILNGCATADIKMLLYWCINSLQKSSYQYTAEASQQSFSKWHSCHSQHPPVLPLTPFMAARSLSGMSLKHLLLHINNWCQCHRYNGPRQVQRSVRDSKEVQEMSPVR